jgi:hypothetical protein
MGSGAGGFCRASDSCDILNLSVAPLLVKAPGGESHFPSQFARLTNWPRTQSRGMLFSDAVELCFVVFSKLKLDSLSEVSARRLPRMAFFCVSVPL